MNHFSHAPRSPPTDFSHKFECPFKEKKRAKRCSTGNVGSRGLRSTWQKCTIGTTVSPFQPGSLSSVPDDLVLPIRKVAKEHRLYLESMCLSDDCSDLSLMEEVLCGWFIVAEKRLCIHCPCIVVFGLVPSPLPLDFLRRLAFFLVSRRPSLPYPPLALIRSTSKHCIPLDAYLR